MFINSVHHSQNTSKWGYTIVQETPILKGSLAQNEVALHSWNFKFDQTDEMSLIILRI